MVGGVIVVAVAIHLAVSKPTVPGHPAFVAICLGGPALYLAGEIVFKHALGRGRLGPPLAGLVALPVLGVPAAFADRLSVLAAAAAVALVLAVRSARDGADRPT
jgi:low temperature requirement protein LtrA